MRTFYYATLAIYNGKRMGCGGMQNSFPPPEVNQNLATLNMFPMMQIDNSVTFLKTLSDGYSQP